MERLLLQELKNRQTAIAVMGLGYTGWPLAAAFSDYFSVIGYDVDAERVTTLEKTELSRVKKLTSNAEAISLQLTTDASELTKASFFIVAVPTPVNHHQSPDLQSLANAVKSIGAVLKKGDCVVIESTVYPGCSEEVCIPLLEKASGLRCGIDFMFGYSPERINPGDQEHRLDNVIKLVAGISEKSLELLVAVYNTIVKAGLYQCSSIKIAEAAKMTENIQRDVNIALMNELSGVYQKLGIDTSAVWNAASTKWNFLPFRPGLAGGHCISVDPYYLLYRAREAGIEPSLIATAREVNEQMVQRVLEIILSHLKEESIVSTKAKVLIKGVSFKPNVSDIRNSKILEVAQLLKAQGVQVEIEDPLVNEEQLMQARNLALYKETDLLFDVIVVATGHALYYKLGEDYFCSHSSPRALILDINGIFRGKITQRKYWSF
jgi:UDP-N-acetyl-D-galactosamine dehydrogenase